LAFTAPSRDPGNTDIPALQQLSSGLVEEVRNLTETGVLSSMLQAIELIRSRDLSNNDFGRMMTGINTVFINLVYPDTFVRLPALDIPQTHNYSRIIREGQRGNYISPPPDSEDFFEHTLPFLAINNQTSQGTLIAALSDQIKAAGLSPNSVLPPYFQGVILERLNRFYEAEAAYTRAYAISSECYPALIGIARIKRITGHADEAEALFSDLVIRYPDNISIKRQLAITYYENREWSRALSAVDEILLIEPRDGDFILMKSHILIEQSQFSQANVLLDSYASINPNNRTYLFLRARVQTEGNRNRDSALNYLRSILRTNPDDIEAMIFAATLLMESQRPADQQESNELLARLRQTSGSSINVLSLSLQNAVWRESWQEARIFLNSILEVRRTPADLINAFHIERGLGNNAAALGYAQELYELNTANNDYAVLYISSLIDNGRRDEASRLLEGRLGAPSSGNVRSQFYYLRSRIQTNDDATLSDLRSSIFEDPRNLDALIAMFEIYFRQREERRAVYYLRQAIAIAPDNPRVRRLEREYASLLERN